MYSRAFFTRDGWLQVAFVGGHAPPPPPQMPLLGPVVLETWELLQGRGSRARDPNTELNIELQKSSIPHCIWEHPAFSGMLKIAHVSLHQLASGIWSYQGDT